MRRIQIILATASLLVYCSDGHSRGGGTAAAPTVSGTAGTQIAVRTTDTGQPLEVNGISFSASDTDETSSPKPVN